MRAASPSARRAAVAWRRRIEADGQRVDQLLACKALDEGGTRLPGCVKTRIPWAPDGEWAVVLEGAVDDHGPLLRFLAFGLRHPPAASNQPTVYERADRRLHS